MVTRMAPSLGAPQRTFGDGKQGANTSVEFVTAAQWDVALFVVLARAAKRRLGEFSG